MKNTSVALGSYFDDFIKAQIAQGRYNNASEVIRAGLRLLEDNESQLLAIELRLIAWLSNLNPANFADACANSLGKNLQRGLFCIFPCQLLFNCFQKETDRAEAVVATQQGRVGIFHPAVEEVSATAGEHFNIFPN